jgi:hypothetical protein
MLGFEDGLQGCFTHLHAFVGIRGTKEFILKTTELEIGDKIWVDVSAFTADKSLFYKKIRK